VEEKDVVDSSAEPAYFSFTLLRMVATHNRELDSLLLFRDLRAGDPTFAERRRVTYAEIWSKGVGAELGAFAAKVNAFQYAVRREQGLLAAQHELCYWEQQSLRQWVRQWGRPDLSQWKKRPNVERGAFGRWTSGLVPTANRGTPADFVAPKTSLRRLISLCSTWLAKPGSRTLAFGWHEARH